MDQVHKCKRFEKHTRMPVFDAKLGVWVMVVYKELGHETVLLVHFCPFCGSDLNGETLLT